MQCSALILFLFGVGIAPIATAWPNSDSFDFDLLCWFGICPDDGEENHNNRGNEEIPTTESPPVPVTCKTGESLLEDYNICIKFDATQESVMDLDEHCGAAEPDIEDDDYEHEKKSNFLLVRTSDNESAIQTVSCGCKLVGLKPSVYDSQTRNCVTLFTQESCEEGEWLIPTGTDEQFQCVPNVCSMIVVPNDVVLYNGTCVGLNDHCDDRGTAKFSINPDTGLVECRTTILTETALTGGRSRKPIPRSPNRKPKPMQKQRTTKKPVRKGN